MIALKQRQNEDERTLGELFFYFRDELADITFAEYYQILLRIMFESICAVFHVTDEQIFEFTSTFVEKLPSYIRNALIRNCIVA